MIEKRILPASGYREAPPEESILKLKSLGLVSSYCLHRPSDTLFDCGDGAATDLGVDIFKPRRICLTHHHLDHIAGLAAFIGLRNSAKGDNYKPLEIYYPKDKSIDIHIQFVKNLFSSLKFKLGFHEVSPGDKIPVGNRTYISAIKTEHTRSSVGYVYNETQKALKPEFSGLDVKKMLLAGKIGPEDLKIMKENKEIRHFAYLLDNCGFPVEEVTGTKEIVLDCTFLDENDRNDKTHCSYEECVGQVGLIQPKTYHLAHFSQRYGKGFSGPKTFKLIE